MLASHSELARELGDLKRSVANLDADTKPQFDQIYEAILGADGYQRTECAVRTLG